MIRYTNQLDGVEPEMLTGFFVGWPHPPSPETHLRLLRSSFAVELAIDERTEKVVGFASAVSDGVLTAYIPLLEVQPLYQGRGIGSMLIRHLVGRLGELYAIDVCCDDSVAPFYAKLGFNKAAGMIRRNYARQHGKPCPPSSSRTERSTTPPPASRGRRTC